MTELVQNLKDSVSHEIPLILIDQEGGKVARLKPPYWRAAPPAKFFADIACYDISTAIEATYLNHRLIAHELYQLGINVNCTPLLDIHIKNSHDIIGNRSFGESPEQVTKLAEAACKGLMAGGVLPVIKHIPGHGRAKSDSHKSLPIVQESLDILSATDFIPFKNLSNMPLAMTAHIEYSAIDNLPATMSQKTIDIIRNHIGFDGLLMTDDLSMKALVGDLANLTKKSLEAGCDIILHCNGKMSEMAQIAPNTLDISRKALTRLHKAYTKLNEPDEFNIDEAISRVDSIISQV